MAFQNLFVTSNIISYNFQVYADFVDNVTVYIGPTFDHSKFFQIDKYDGSEYLTGFGNKCPQKIVNSTEGLSYPQYLTKNDTLRYWRKTLCRVGELIYASKYKKSYAKYEFAYKYLVTNS